MDATTVSSLAVGWVIGFVVIFFVVRFTVYSAAILASIVTIIFGGVVLEFLADGKFSLQYYGIGVAIGIATYLLLYGIENRSVPKVLSGKSIFRKQ